LKAEDFEPGFLLVEVGEPYAEIDESNEPENFRRRDFADHTFRRCGEMGGP
jgi:hypothetical protein